MGIISCTCYFRTTCRYNSCTSLFCKHTYFLNYERICTDIFLILPTNIRFVSRGQPSVWRASLMTFLVVFLTKWKIKLSYSDVISIIFLLLVTIQKHIIYHIGFQFSFLVTFALILSQGWVQHSTTKLESAFKISFVAQMVILPLQFHYFSHFQPLSILLNLLIVPYFSLLVIPLMFLLLFIGFLPNIVLLIVEYPFMFIHNIMMKSLAYLDTLIPFAFTFSNIGMSIVFLYYVLFVFMMMALEKKSSYIAFG